MYHVPRVPYVLYVSGVPYVPGVPRVPYVSGVPYVSSVPRVPYVSSVPYVPRVPRVPRAPVYYMYQICTTYLILFHIYYFVIFI